MENQNFYNGVYYAGQGSFFDYVNGPPPTVTTTSSPCTVACVNSFNTASQGYMDQYSSTVVGQVGATISNSANSAVANANIANARREYLIEMAIEADNLINCVASC